LLGEQRILQHRNRAVHLHDAGIQCDIGSGTGMGEIIGRTITSKVYRI